MEHPVIQLDERYIDNEVSEHPSTYVKYDPNDFYFWLDDRKNPRMKVYFMVKRLINRKN